MGWYKVKVIAKVGIQFEFVSDEEGVITLVVKNPGEEWPHNTIPIDEGHQIAEGFTSYVVYNKLQEIHSGE